MLAWGFTMLLGIIYLTLTNNAFPDIPMGLQTITAGILFGKLVQNHQEGKGDSDEIP
jgi:hypothetical protein